MSEASQVPSSELNSRSAWSGSRAPLPSPVPVGAERFGDDELLAAPPALAEFVLYFWRREFPRGRTVTIQPTMPDGCFDLMAVDDGEPYVMGPETVRADHAVAGGTVIVGVRLRPGVGARLFGHIASRLTDGGAFARDLDRRPGAARQAMLAVGQTPPAHRPLIEALVPRIAAATPDDGVAFGVAWLACHPAATVDDLCARLGWSPREVRRRFCAALGFGPKVMQRMLRFQRVLSEVRRAGSAATLARIAAAAGYADQAHMTREFRALAHTTPGSLLAGPFDPTLDPILFHGAR